MAGYGNFVWYELLTSDKNAAESFYGRVMGWKGEDSGQPGVDYTLLSVDGARIGGMMKLPEDACKAGARPGWFGYIGVEDADDCAKRVEARGGSVHRAPENIPGYGRFAVLADPQGAVFCAIAPAIECAGTPSEAFKRGVPGFGGWHELNTDDPEGAFDFYSDLFDWRKDQAFDMGAMGVYQLFAVNGVPTGGIMKRPPQMPSQCWNYYFNVESVDAAAARIGEAGGQVAMGPHQVPDGSWILLGFDPQGVMFSLNSQEK
jgi:predicted enzyme related to lactoylglutathione lyase